MATEEYSIGYEEGHQAGWNAAMDSLPAQRTWVGLTEEEINELFKDGLGFEKPRAIYLEIESKLKEKNT